MKEYPFVLDEDATLDRILSGESISRFGDGELRLALGGTSPSQCADPELATLLRFTLSHPGRCMVGIPHHRGPKGKNWEKYTTAGKFRKLFEQNSYVSAFITRPDNAPWIDNEVFWGKIKSIWENRDVVLVYGSERSLTPIRLEGAKSVTPVEGPRRDAFQFFDVLCDKTRLAVEVIGKPRDVPIILCLGATATVMAHMLAQDGFWAIDLGHCGMFMRRRGLFESCRVEEPVNG